MAHAEAQVTMLARPLAKLWVRALVDGFLPRVRSLLFSSLSGLALCGNQVSLFCKLPLHRAKLRVRITCNRGRRSYLLFDGSYRWWLQRVATLASQGVIIPTGAPRLPNCDIVIPGRSLPGRSGVEHLSPW